MKVKTCSALCSAMALSCLNAFAGLLFDFYASDWAGPNNEWVSRTGSLTLFYDTFNGSAPQKGTDSIGGVTVDTAVFDGNDFFTTLIDQTNRPWAGRTEFSISIVFRSITDTSNSETDLNAFWNHEGIIGFEMGGTGQGEFGIGLYNDGSANGAVAAGTGLASMDVGTPGGAINDNAWHTLTLIVDDLGNGFFNQTVYVDGGQAGQITNLSYGGGAPILANESFSLGQIRSGGGNPFTGAVAAFRFDDNAIQESDIASLHSTYLGLIPEFKALSIWQQAGALNIAWQTQSAGIFEVQGSTNLAAIIWTDTGVIVTNLVPYSTTTLINASAYYETYRLKRLRP